MPDSYIDPKVLEDSKVHPTIIKLAAAKIPPKTGNKARKKENCVIEHAGHRVFIVYEHLDDGTLYIRNARYAKR